MSTQYWTYPKEIQFHITMYIDLYINILIYLDQLDNFAFVTILLRPIVIQRNFTAICLVKLNFSIL